MQGFTLKTAAFDGPLDLLLTLIEERKMLITDVSLAEVADAFLAYIAERNEFPLRDTAQFIVVAATLLLIKSRSLLPVLTLSNDEEGDIRDLERRLKLLQIFRDIARRLERTKTRIYLSEGSPITDPLFVPPPDLSPAALVGALHDVLANAPRRVVRDEVKVEHVVSLDEMIERLTKRIQNAINLTFAEFSKDAIDTREVVVSFLAILELVKRGLARAEQGTHFDEITIEYAGNTGTPSYE